MAFIEIDSVDDERLAVFRLRERGLTTRADKRDDTGAGLFLAEGDLVVTRALEAGCEPLAALADADRVPTVAERLGIDVFIGGDEIRRLVTGLGMPHPIVAVFHRPARPSAAPRACPSRTSPSRRRNRATTRTNPPGECPRRRSWPRRRRCSEA